MAGQSALGYRSYPVVFEALFVRGFLSPDPKNAPRSWLQPPRTYSRRPHDNGMT